MRNKKQRKEEDPIFGHLCSIPEKDEWVNTTDKMDRSCITNGHWQLPQREKSKRLTQQHTLYETHKQTVSHLPTHTASHPKIIFTLTAVTLSSMTCDICTATLFKKWRTTWRLRDLCGDGVKRRSAASCSL